MKKIFKYELIKGTRIAPELPGGIYEVEMPKTAKIISAKLLLKLGNCYHGTPTLWAIINENEEREIKRFVVLETGEEMPQEVGPANFISTIFDENSNLVFHIFQMP
jgi:hypothetical protein